MPPRLHWRRLYPPRAAMRSDWAPCPKALSLAVPEGFVRRNAIPHELLQFLRFREPPLAAPGKERVAVQPHLEHPVAAGNERHFAKLGLEGRQQLLGQPCGPQQPAAARTVFDFQARCHHTLLPRGIETLPCDHVPSL